MMIKAKQSAPHVSSAARILGLALALSLIISCSKNGEDKSDSEEIPSSSRIVVLAPGASEQRTKIPISFVQSNDHISNDNISTFSLTTSNADAWTIELTDCLSGYDTTVTEANVDGLEIYRFDRECRAKLTEFIFDGKTYIPTAGDPFTNWQAGDIATFDEVGEPGVNPLRLMVLSTIGNPVTGLETISFGWATITQGSDRSILWTTAGASDKLTVAANPPPSFTIKSIERTGMSPGAGGQFKFVLECTSHITITNICELVSFSDLDYKLVEDTFGGSISSMQGDSIFATPGTSVMLPDDRIAPGSAGTTNGGIITISLDGPDNMANHPHMLLVIRSYGQSFQYFNVDVAVAPTY